MNQILICNNCGKENSNKRYFCEKCGMLLCKCQYKNVQF
ncbi:zinc-ribbon domain-containing protein [Veillonella sp. ACP1]